MGIRTAKSAIDLGIVTNNGPAMLGFYRDTLGLPYLREMPMPGGIGTMHQLACGDTVIKLVVLNAPAAPAVPGGITGGTGYRYWTITVHDIPEILQACEQAGAKVVAKERELRPGVKIAIVADPDGNWVEFLSVAG
jgi:catechol 2,3-dioxygenase-like lactoylglutathione lyase family enzyme